MHRLEQIATRFAGRIPRVSDPQKAVRLAEYLAVGASGVIIDTLVLLTVLGGGGHYLLANMAAFLVANSWNFTLNKSITWRDREGSIVEQYLAYLGYHSASFIAFRATTVTLLVSLAGVPALPASLAGVALAAVVNFAASERLVFASAPPQELAAEAANAAIHRVYSRRYKHALQRLGLWDTAYSVYQRLVGGMHSRDHHTIHTGNVSVDVSTETAAETASVLHTEQKEGLMLDEYARTVLDGDCVWDVGANLGVYSLVACEAGAERVVAYEPHPPTADRLAEQVSAEPVTPVAAALGSDPGETHLAVERDETGTQTPSLSDDGEYTVSVNRGDDLADAFHPRPDVVKIDVEGHEKAVLAGMPSVLNDARAAFVEVHDDVSVEPILEEHFETVKRRKAAGQTYLFAVTLGK